MNDRDRARVLVVEDELAQQKLLAVNLKAQGYMPISATNGDEALLLIAEDKPDLIILDWMLPGVSGIEICRRLKADRDTRDIPVIMLSARSEETDRVRGLETGADDYVVKPYSVAELMARVKRNLSRSVGANDGETLEFGDLTMDIERHRVFRGEHELSLGPTEFRLLRTFLERPGRVWSREQLLDRVWGRDIYVETRTVDVHVGRLRKALTQAGTMEDPIRTIRGSGYALG
jgi:two-component system phosphate regulon response regulator PhoB